MAGLAVVLSGGGAKGAFQVGVLDELITQRGVRIDIFAGVSTGAIQALGGAQDDLPGLLDQWLSLRGKRDVYKDRPLGAAGALLGADSIYDAKAIRTRIRAFAKPDRLKASGRKLLLGVVSLSSGQYRSIDESVPNIGDWVYASCAMPVYFQPLETKAADGIVEQWVDGGVRNVTPLDDTLEQNPRAVLVVLASPPPGTKKPKVYDNLVEIGLRSVSILRSEVVLNDTRNAGLINDLLAAREAQVVALARAGIGGAQAAAVLAPFDATIARYRFAPIRMIAPETEVSDTLEFDPVKIRAGIDAGRRAVDQQWDMLAPFLRV